MGFVRRYLRDEEGLWDSVPLEGEGCYGGVQRLSGYQEDGARYFVDNGMLAVFRALVYRQAVACVHACDQLVV